MEKNNLIKNLLYAFLCLVVFSFSNTALGQCPTMTADVSGGSGAQYNFTVASCPAPAMITTPNGANYNLIGCVGTTASYIYAGGGSGPEALPTFFDFGGGEPPCEYDAAGVFIPIPVPTLSQWGIFLFFVTVLCLTLITSFNVQRQKSLATANGNINLTSHLQIPFDQKGFKAALKTALMLVPFGFAFIYSVWGEIIADDFIGMMMSIPLVAYLIYLLKK